VLAAKAETGGGFAPTDASGVVAARTVGSIPATGAPEFFPEIEQRSEEWYGLRRGIPTASRFDAIMAAGEGASRETYMDMLIGEEITGRLGYSYRNEDMDRGTQLEPEAREAYGRSRFCTLATIGFARRRLPSGRYVGASPDALVDQDGVLEIKTRRDDLMVKLLRRGQTYVPNEYRPQCQGTLWVTGRQWCDLVIYCHESLPLAVFRLMRDEAYIKRLSDAVEVFDYDLHQEISKIRRMK
jgi:putative phage-type endonuclease